MTADRSFVAALRPELEFRGRWGIYAARSDTWLDVVFASEREADESIRVLRSAKRR